MDRRIKKTNSAIFEAYFKAKISHPKQEPSVKEVCAIADINKTTFYRYYTDIDSLSHAIIKEAVNTLLIEGIDVEKLLADPEVYFKHVLLKLDKDRAKLSVILADNNLNLKFIFEAERLLKAKLKETVPDRYDEVLCTFIAGGAAHYFLSANYNDGNELQKFCRIIKAATSAV